MLRLGVLGAGRIGRIHAANVANSPHAALVGVADPVGEAARDLAAVFGCAASTDPTTLLERDDVDAVVICSPTDTHITLMLEAVEHNKAVLCEKPIDLDIAKVDAAVAAVERLGGRVMVAFNRRYDPSAQAVHRTVEAGEIGDLRQVIITSRDPSLPSRRYLEYSGGIFRDMLVHDFDMARWLLGEEPVEVMATASRLIDPTLAEIDDFDTVMVNLRTASGRQCHINCCRAAVYGYDQRIEVFGSAGMVMNDNLRPTTLRRWTRTSTESHEPLLHFFLERYADAYRLELASFLSAVATGSPMPVTIQDGRQALHLANSALQSAVTSAAVAV